MPSKKSFLPEDYVRDARERRSGLFALALFVIVMGAVFSAFLVTNRQWAAVRSAQVSINDETEKAAKEINEMKRLEAMRAQMIEKAELARGLIEPVPRTVLLACLVNTMPANLSLIEFEMKSEEIKSNRQTGAQAKEAAKARRMTKATQPEVATSGAAQTWKKMALPRPGTGSVVFHSSTQPTSYWSSSRRMRSADTAGLPMTQRL